MKPSTLYQTLGAALFVLVLTPVLAAEKPDAPMGGKKGDAMMDGGPGAQQMSPMMHDMSGQMKQMADMMTHGNMDAAMQKQMAERMQAMSSMMEHMSGMMGHSMMMDGNMQKQMGDMRKQMDEMMKQPVGPAKK